MKRYVLKWLAGLILGMFLAQCSTVPITGRKQVNLLPESEMASMGMTSYQNFLDSSKVVRNTSEQRMVVEVGNRISVAVEQFMKDNKLESRLDHYSWEFNLVDDPVLNAWCMPGGKVVVYTGILPVCQDDAGLAVVMGHEIAHAVARHGNERMSQALLVQMGGMALSVATQEKPEETQMWFLAAYGVASQLGVMLPYSRAHETEADKLGMIFMAMAGYDPSLAIGFWERMSAQSGAKPPEFLSTHPSDDTRIKDLKSFLPKALKYYNNPAAD